MASHIGTGRFVVLTSDHGLIRTIESSIAGAEVDVVPVSTIHAALDQVGAPMTSGTAVLADLDGAGLDGLDFIRVITADTPDAPVAVVYGPESEALAAQAVQIGAACCFAKPLGPSDVRQALARMRLDRHDAVEAAEPSAGTSVAHLADLVAECGQALGIVARRWRRQGGTELDVSIQTEAASVYMPPAAVSHVASALLLNALEAVRDQPHGRVVVRCGLAGTRAYFAVVDDGHGMDEHVLNEACAPFFTTRHHRGALGLGLANALDDVRTFGGTIKLRSRPGHGTTAIVELPAALGGVTVFRQGTQHRSPWDRLLLSVPEIEEKG